MSVNPMVSCFLFLPGLEYHGNKQGSQRATLNNSQERGEKAVRAEKGTA